MPCLHLPPALVLWTCEPLAPLLGPLTSVSVCLFIIATQLFCGCLHLGVFLCCIEHTMYHSSTPKWKCLCQRVFLLHGIGWVCPPPMDWKSPSPSVLSAGVLQGLLVSQLLIMMSVSGRFHVFCHQNRGRINPVLFPWLWDSRRWKLTVVPAAGWGAGLTRPLPHWAV